MANLNKVMLIGNLTRDIELKTLQGGSSVASFGLAINRNWVDANKEKREEVTFVDCTAWGKTGEVMAKYLSKGRPVYVEGRMATDTWDDKETGQKRTKTKVVVETFQFLDSGKDKASGDVEVKPKSGGGFKPIEPADIPW